jgi:hypothetical protein
MRRYEQGERPYCLTKNVTELSSVASPRVFSLPHDLGLGNPSRDLRAANDHS